MRMTHKSAKNSAAPNRPKNNEKPEERYALLAQHLQIMEKNNFNDVRIKRINTNENQSKKNKKRVKSRF